MASSYLVDVVGAERGNRRGQKQGEGGMCRIRQVQIRAHKVINVGMNSAKKGGLDCVSKGKEKDAEQDEPRGSESGVSDEGATSEGWVRREVCGAFGDDRVVFCRHFTEHRLAVWRDEGKVDLVVETARERL